MTSQIFANIYLNEFDRFVRHQLKPQAYLRYGDDFILFAPTRHNAQIYYQRAEDFLASCLKLITNPKNHAVFAAAQGLRFLGHDISAQSVVVDQCTTKSVLQKVSLQNIASYRSLYLDDINIKQLDWLLVAEYDRIIDK